MLEAEQARKMRRLLWKWGGTIYYVQRKEQEIQCFLGMIADAYNTLQSYRITDMPIAKGLPTSSVERAVEDVERSQALYEKSVQIIRKSIEQALALKQAIDEAIEALEPIEQKVLTMRYVDDHQWAFIALKLSYDERHAKRIEQAAIEKLSRNVTFTVL